MRYLRVNRILTLSHALSLSRIRSSHTHKNQMSENPIRQKRKSHPSKAKIPSVKSENPIRQKRKSRSFVDHSIDRSLSRTRHLARRLLEVYSGGGGGDSSSGTRGALLFTERCRERAAIRTAAPIGSCAVTHGGRRGGRCCRRHRRAGSVRCSVRVSMVACRSLVVQRVAPQVGDR